MGDVILTSPLLSYLKGKYPDSEVTLLTDSNFSELFTDDPRLLFVKGITKDERELPVQILKEHWNLVIDLQDNPRSRKFIIQLEHKESIGRFDKLHGKRLLLLCSRLNSYPEKNYVALRYIHAADKKSNELIPSRLFFSSPLPKRIQKMFQNGKIIRPSVALFPFSAWRNKEWPQKNYIEIGRYFLLKGWNVIIMGGPQEQKKAEIVRLMIGQRCVSFAGKISLYECGCVLKRCVLALGNDSGLSHLARACGVKTGIVYGPTTRHFGFYPYGSPSFKVFENKLLCRPCHAHGGNICLRFNRACMRNTGVNQVIDGLMQLYHDQQ